jgi:hypothetical protein
VTRTARTLVGSAILLAALLAVVALASRGQLGPDSATSRLRPSLPPAAFAYVYAGFLVVGAVALPFFFYLYVRETPYSRKRRRRAWLAPFALVGAAGLSLWIAARWGEQLSDALARLQFWRDGGGEGIETVQGAQPPEPGWLPVTVVSMLVATGAATFAAWHGVRRRRRLRRRGSLADTLSGVVDETLDDLHAEPDARRAIIVAYARMEAGLERSGVARQHSEAPLEYLARVLIELEVTAGPVRSLTELFEWAKFSHHEIEAGMKDEAIQALEAVRADLRELG